jgi:hypothetical protein
MKTGCTPFLLNMMATPDAKLVRADPHKLADKYGLRFTGAASWVKMSLEHHRGK